MGVTCLSNNAESSHMRETRSFLEIGMRRCARRLTCKDSYRIRVNNEPKTESCSDVDSVVFI